MLQAVTSRAPIREASRARIRFTRATAADDAEILRLLRDNPMAGRISLSFEREPSYFLEEQHTAGKRKTIVAFEDGRLVCVGSCSMRQRFIGGRAQSVGYLGGLRLDAKAAGRFDILRRGYQFFRETEDSQMFYFTSIAADNERAIRFLERGLPGMPIYEHLTDFVTLTLSVPQFVRPHDRVLNPVSFDNLPELVTFLNDCAAPLDLAPCWNAEELLTLSNLGLNLEDLLTLRDSSALVGCAAIWDQRNFRQAVVRGYTPTVARMRRSLNVISRVMGRGRLPAVGEVLSIGLISHFAIASASAEALTALIQGLFPIARKKGLELLGLGFAADDPRLETVLSRFPTRQYWSRLYRVRWPGQAEVPVALRKELIFPDVALL